MAEGSEALELPAMNTPPSLLLSPGCARAASAQARAVARTPTPAPTPGPPVPLKVARAQGADRPLPASGDAPRGRGRVARPDAREHLGPARLRRRAENAVGRAACLFVDRGEHLDRVAIVASYDTDAFEKSGLYTRVIPYGKEGAGAGF